MEAATLGSSESARRQHWQQVPCTAVCAPYTGSLHAWLDYRPPQLQTLPALAHLNYELCLM